MDVYPLEGLKTVLVYMQPQITAGGVILRLAKTVVVIDADTVLSDFVEATFPGYAQVVRSASAVDDNGAGRGRLTFTPAITWTRAAGAGSESIYAWYMVDNTDTKLLACQAWPDAPVTIDTAGQFLTLVPRILDKSEV